MLLIGACFRHQFVRPSRSFCCAPLHRNDRLHQVYGVISEDFEESNEDGSDEDVDEHRQHADIITQLQGLKASTKV